MAKEYNFDAVMTACSSGSYLSDSLDSLQDNIEKLQKLIKELEEAYHGIGYKSSIFKMYEALYENIGSASNYNYWNNSGVWSAVQNIVYKTDILYSNAERDKADWEEEQRRIAEEEERKRQEAAANNS